MELLRKLAFPIAFLYGLAVRIRNLLYDTGLLSSRTYETPTIGIGNLSVGGTGKTPMVELLIGLFSGSQRLAVLSRGYRRKTKGFILATASSVAEEIGDEPMQLHAKFPDLVVAVDADRRRGITRLQQEVSPDLILLDDVFQHRRVRPTITVLLTAYGRLYPDDYYLPSGTLRDGKAEAVRADIIVVTKCPEDLGNSEQVSITAKLKPAPHQLLLFSSLEYDRQLGGGESPLSLDTLKGKEVLLVTGIADPEPLLAFLRKFGLTFRHRRFPDHHFFTREEVREFAEAASVLCTEKDYRRMQHPPVNCHYIRMKHRFLGNGLKMLKERLQVL